MSRKCRMCFGSFLECMVITLPINYCKEVLEDVIVSVLVPYD